MNKSDEKRLRAFTRRAEVLKSRQIKIMTDEKRQNEVLLSKSI
jgi:hypothetical protein